MIAGCPSCGARYRIDTGKLGPEGARLRCSRCEHVFPVHPPTRTPASESRIESPHSASSAPAVLIAHPEPEAGKAVVDALGAWGLAPTWVADGVEAILQVQRLLPRAVILDAALPKMFGFQVCELMKRNEQLRSIPVVLVGAIHDESRYRRPPNELYGADAYAERQQLPDALVDPLRRFGLPLRLPAPERTAPPPSPAPPPPRSEPRPIPQARQAPQAPEAPASPPAPAPSPPAPAAGDDKAARLARIIVSDIVLYNPEKFDAALRDGNVIEALSAELAEGDKLFAQRIDRGAEQGAELLRQELLRVARSRGMKQ